MQAHKGGFAKLDITKTGKTTEVVSYGPPTKQYPRGGTLNRLERILIHPTESWDSVIQRLLDFRDEHSEPDKRSYKTEYKE